MELTLDQALQKGIEAHRAGKVQEADRYYTAILKANPKHPDANHNMGVLAVGVGKVNEALPFFKTALEVNPSIAQFWLSYIDALIKLERMDDAKVGLGKARRHIGNNEILDRFDCIIKNTKDLLTGVKKPKENPFNTLSKFNLEKALKLAIKKAEHGLYDEANNIYTEVLEKFPQNKKALKGKTSLEKKWKIANSANISEVPLKTLDPIITLYSQKKFQKALRQAKKLLVKFPNSFDLYNLIGVINRKSGRFDAAITAYKQALTINPRSAEAHNNIGNVFMDQGKVELAIKNYEKATEIKPDYAEAHNNLAHLHKDNRNFEHAIVRFEKALSFKPSYVDALNGLGNAYRSNGDFEKAKNAYREVIRIGPDADPDKPMIFANAAHMLASLEGKTTNAPPNEYVESLFNSYAENFESSLVVELKYQIPEKLINTLLTYSDSDTFGSVVDLGCGTGLVGLEISKHCSYLEGVDLSKPMIEKAEIKNVYNKLVHEDILEYLSNRKLNFDCFIFADVFIYLGNLSKVFQLIKSRNLTSGKIVFSTEDTSKVGFFLEKSGRYSHSKTYIDKLCKQYGYSIIHFSKTNLREENGKFLTGGIYVLEF